MRTTGYTGLMSLMLLLPSWVVAESLPAASSHALVLLAPEGRWAMQVELRQNGYDKRYDAGSKKQSLGASFDGVNLDVAMFPAIGLLGPGASLGTTSLGADVQYKRLQITLGYGVTPDITVGTIMDYSTTRTNVNFSVVGGNVGFNPLYNPANPIGPANFPFAPAAGPVRPVGTQGVQQILTSPVFGFGYKPIQSATVSTFGDPAFGGLWRAYEDDAQSVVLGAAYRVGMAKNDDPDNLFDVVGSDSSNDVFVQAEYFRNFSMGTDVRLKTTRTWQFPDHVDRRVPASGQVLATLASKERLKRNLGDYWEYDVELGQAWGDWRVSGSWHRWQKNADTYTSSKGSHTAALMAFTQIDADQWRASLSWSGIHAWQDKGMPIPLIAKLEVQQTYRGRNMTDVKDIYLLLTTFF